jgi:hypothetical protein
MKAVETINNMRTGDTLTMLVSEEENRGARRLYQVRLPLRRPNSRKLGSPERQTFCITTATGRSCWKSSNC